MKEQIRIKGQEKQLIGSIKGNGGPLSGTIYRFRDWREAAEWSTSRKAISADMIDVCIPGTHGSRPMRMKAHLCIEIEGGKMSYRFHSSVGIPIDYLPKPTAKDIDAVKYWKAW